MKRDEFMDLVGANYVDEYDKAQLSQERTTIVAKSKRTFVELLVQYPHPDVCTYPEYKGKPYYSIKYIEGGECFVGFGTYKPEVLSQYLRDYFMPPALPEERTCVNCGRTANNGGWYADGGTRCPIEEHYALPKDGYCHLWEKRNVTDDDYPERREDERPES